MTRLIIDCDPGIDDALALLLACGSPEFELLGITTVAGNRPAPITAANACRLMDLAGRHEVPVFMGAVRPLAQAQPRCNLVHGEDGLGGVVLPAGRTPAAEHASDFIARTLLAEPAGSVTLVAVGPLTNLALAEIKHPGLLQRAKTLAVMGGAAFQPGNITPCAEFNFYADPLAAHTVMSCGQQVHLFGLDVTSKAVMSEDWIASLGMLHTRSAQAAHAMLHAYALEDPLLHDACPLAWLLEPALFRGETCTVEVDWRPGLTEGQSCALRRPGMPDAGRANAVVYTHVDGPRLLALVRERLASLP
jgi:purine nucleosidase